MCYCIQNTKCKLSLRILTDLLNLCQECLAIIKIDGVKVCLYDVNCENQHKNVDQIKDNM
jgi:hypothetical protein